jgi:hypothetical protein
MLEIVAPHIDNFGHLDEIGEGLRSHLPHDLSSMHLHRGFREPGFCCHLLVHQSGRHQSHHFALARTQSLKQSAHPGCRFIAFPAYAITLDGDRDGVQDVLLAEWFRQEIHRARLHCSRRHGNIGVSGHEDDGDADVRAGELGLKIEAADARQPDVEHQTACGIGQLARQEFSRRAEYLGLQADVSEEIVKRLSHRDIVVDDEDNRVLRIARKPLVDGTFPC